MNHTATQASGQAASPPARPPRNIRPRKPPPGYNLALDMRPEQGPRDTELLDSPLWDLLYADGGAANGTWVPTWIIRATKSEARARVLCEILWWFETDFGAVRKAESRPIRTRPRPRAKVIDANGVNWYATGAARIAERTMLANRTAADALRWLANQELIISRPRDRGGVAVRPNAPGLAKAYLEQTGDTITNEFLDLHGAGAADWFGSATQRQAAKSPGVTVHNVFVLMLADNKRRHDAHFLARLLSQIVYRFGDRKGRPAARHTRDGALQWATSHGRLAQELGVSHASVKRGLATLRRLGLIHTRIDRFRLAGQNQHRSVSFLRPCVKKIYEQVQAALQPDKRSRK